MYTVYMTYSSTYKLCISPFRRFFLTESLFLGASTKRFDPTRYMYNNRLHMASEIPSKKK